MTALPRASAAGPPALERLVSSRTGVVRSVQRAPSRGEAASGWLAELADPSRWGGTAMGNPTTAGGAWQDEGRAAGAALGEAVERYCGSLIPSELPVGSARRLRECGEQVLSPDELALHAPWQHQQRGFPFVRLDDDTESAWAEAQDLATGETVLVPASVVYLSVVADAYGVPVTNYPVGAGIAAGPTPEDAIEAALSEVIERHALATSWAQGAAYAPLPIPPSLSAAGRLASVAGVEAWAVPNFLDVPVVLVAAVDGDRELIGVGSAQRATEEAATWKAFSEALLSLDSARALDDPSHPIHELTAAGQTPLKAHRSDRRYGAQYAEDWRDVTDLACHVQLLLDPEVRGAVLDRLSVAPASLGSPATSSGAPAERLRELGFRVLAVDVTTTDVRAAGPHVVRVVVPGLRATAPAAFPFLGGRDLAAEGPGELYRLPVPLA